MQTNIASQLPDLDNLLNQAEAKFNKSVHLIGEWNTQARDSIQAITSLGEQARRMIEQNPGLIVGAIAFGGLATGALIRDRNAILDRAKADTGLNPTIVFGIAAVAGFLFGPHLLDKVLGPEAKLATGGSFGGALTGVSRGSPHHSRAAVEHSIASNRTISGL